MKKPNILFFAANEYASAYYRIIFPAQEIKKQKLANVRILTRKDKKNAEKHEKEWIEWADIVVFELTTNIELVGKIPSLREKGKKVVIDYDDNLLDVPIWNPAYFGLGTQYVDVYTDKEGNHMDLKTNEINRYGIIRACEEADLITSTGPVIRDAYAEFNSNSKIWPNCVDFRLIKPCKKSTDGKVRIFWQGSATHTGDLNEINQVFEQISLRYPQVEWIIWGSGYDNMKNVFGNVPKERITFLETVPFTSYYEKLNGLTLDIGICPLMDIPYNRCKSPVKWLEYSALKIPAVVSDVSTYTDYVEHEKTALVANRHAKWVSRLSRLIENETLRAEISERAYNEVKDKYNIQTRVHDLTGIYETLCQT